MAACEKCWRDSRAAGNYREVLESRKDHPCTPEEQAGPDASKCPLCERMVIHQFTGGCMAGCKQDERAAHREAG